MSLVAADPATPSAHLHRWDLSIGHCAGANRVPYPGQLRASRTVLSPITVREARARLIPM